MRAVREARNHTGLPLLGVGGIVRAEDAVGYARAGADLVQVGTASFALPTAGPRLARDLERWGRTHRVSAWRDLQPVRA